MICRKCKYEFWFFQFNKSWVCMGSWASHGNAWYSCNRFEQKESVEARSEDKQIHARKTLERYLHVIKHLNKVL